MNDLAAAQPYEIRIATILRELGIPATFAAMPLQREATDLVSVRSDIYGREQRLASEAAVRWQSMSRAAEGQGVSLLLVSAFRSVEYQRGIWERKLAMGESVQQILSVSAPPGYSEHHTGRAVDVTVEGCAPVSEEFERTPAFEWVMKHARAFGFTMTYARHNQYGVSYEPWHWALSSFGLKPAKAGLAAGHRRPATDNIGMHWALG